MFFLHARLFASAPPSEPEGQVDGRYIAEVEGLDVCAAAAEQSHWNVACPSSATPAGSTIALLAVKWTSHPGGVVMLLSFT